MIDNRWIMCKRAARDYYTRSSVLYKFKGMCLLKCMYECTRTFLENLGLSSMNLLSFGWKVLKLALT